VILSRKAELDQFIDGLGPIVNLVGKYPDVMEPAFVEREAKAPTPQEFLNLTVFENVRVELQTFLQQYLENQGIRFNLKELIFCSKFVDDLYHTERVSKFKYV